MQKAIVIGATSGIGKGLAEILVYNNYKTGITGRRKLLLEELKATNPDMFVTAHFDVTDNSYEVNLDNLINELGGLDLFIYNSGTGNINKELAIATDEETIAVNVLAFNRFVSFAYNYFEKQGYGHLVAISSIAGYRGAQYIESYNASKAYQHKYLQGLRKRAFKHKSKIIITDIRPGLVDTDMAKGAGLFWVQPVKKVVNQIFKAIKNKKHIKTVSKRWMLIGWLMRNLPSFIYNRL